MREAGKLIDELIMTPEEREQQEKFEFLKAAAIAIHASRCIESNATVLGSMNEARELLIEVWRHKGKL